MVIAQRAEQRHAQYVDIETATVATDHIHHTHQIYTARTEVVEMGTAA